jgi:DNA topoisomerase-1
VQHLLEQGVDPKKIVMITFTNAAAEEMAERLGRPKGLFIGTIHSYANYLLLSNGNETQDLLEEEQFDKIAVGRANWIETVDTFYKTFKPLLSSIPPGKMEGRVLGNDPATGLPVIAKISKIGPCIQLGDATTEKPRFASLKKGQSIYSITLNEALELFRTSLPMTIGEYDGKEVIVGEGKYGPYVHYDNLYISIPRTKDPLTVKLEEAIAMIEEKKEASMPIHDWGDIKVLRSKYGAYIHTPEGNYRIAKSTDAEQLTEAEVKRIIAQSEPLTPGKRTFRRKSAK